jgi:hypothetical protein
MLDLVSLDTGGKTVAVTVVGFECSKVQKSPLVHVPCRKNLQGIFAFGTEPPDCERLIGSALRSGERGVGTVSGCWKRHVPPFKQRPATKKRHISFSIVEKR